MSNGSRRLDPSDSDGPESTASMREGLDREYASMGTGEAGAGVGGGGATSSDVEWEDARQSGGETAAEPDEELTSGGAMTNEQDLVDDET
jgi:hypothetical protein